MTTLKFTVRFVTEIVMHLLMVPKVETSYRA